ncbi:MAG: FAD-binding protein [Pirellulales bacterium]
MRVAFLTKDLLFSSRVTSVTTKQNIELFVLADADELIERVSTVAVKVILLDLSTSGLDPAQLVPQLQKLTPAPRAIIAFGPHVHEAKLAAARNAGCDQVLSRGEFNHRMDEIFTSFLRELNGHNDTFSREPNGQDDAFSREMKQAFGDLVSFQEVIRGIHATDASHYQIMPRCVVTPRDEADLVQAVSIAAKYKVPTTARGGGTSLSGQTHGPGMILDVSRHMNRILKIQPQEGWAQVQPGVVRDHLNAAVAEFGLQYAPDPATTSRATVGGMIGNNSSGTRSVVYGKSSDHLLASRVVLADGRVIDFENCAFSEWASTPAEPLLRGLKEIVDAHADTIRTKFPKVMRRVAGMRWMHFSRIPWQLRGTFRVYFLSSQSVA